VGADRMALQSPGDRDVPPGEGAAVAGERLRAGDELGLGGECGTRSALPRSPPAGRQARWKAARPTDGLTARIVRSVEGVADRLPQPASVPASRNEQNVTSPRRGSITLTIRRRRLFSSPGNKPGRMRIQRATQCQPLGAAPLDRVSGGTARSCRRKLHRHLPPPPTLGLRCRTPAEVRRTWEDGQRLQKTAA
jgi:hypothetical protein